MPNLDESTRDKDRLFTGNWKDDYGVKIAGYMFCIGLPAALIYISIKEWFF